VLPLTRLPVSVAKIHVAFDARHRRLLHHEVGEGHLDVASVGFQALGHLRQQRAKRFHRDLALAMQDLHETRHVRALEVVRQVHVHVEVGDRVLLALRAVLDAHRVVDVFDSDLVDRNLAGVGAALHVFDGDHLGLRSDC